MRGSVSEDLYQAIADAQAAAQRAHTMAYQEPCSYWLRAALGRAQAILIRWQVALASSGRSG